MTATPAQPANGEAAGLAAQLAESLTRASWRLRRTSVKELAPLGLTFAQSRVLRILARRGEPLRIGDLAARFEVAPRSATSMIDSLEAAGLVRRLADPTDRRSVLVGLTPDGLALMERLGDLRRQSAETLFDCLTPAQQRDLLALLSVLCEADEGCRHGRPGGSERPARPAQPEAAAPGGRA